MAEKQEYVCQLCSFNKQVEFIITLMAKYLWGNASNKRRQETDSRDIQ